jgi:Tfp pilus assembly protein PilX
MHDRGFALVSMIMIVLIVGLISNYLISLQQSTMDILVAEHHRLSEGINKNKSERINQREF